VTVNSTADPLDKIHQMQRDLARCREDEYPDHALGHPDSIEGFVRIGFVREN
jgi:hypothetical protein